MENSDVVR